MEQASTIETNPDVLETASIAFADWWDNQPALAKAKESVVFPICPIMYVKQLIASYRIRAAYLPAEREGQLTLGDFMRGVAVLVAYFGHEAHDDLMDSGYYDIILMSTSVAAKLTVTDSSNEPKVDFIYYPLVVSMVTRMTACLLAESYSYSSYTHSGALPLGLLNAYSSYMLLGPACERAIQLLNVRPVDQEQLKKDVLENFFKTCAVAEGFGQTYQ